jgi:hypothetical protein
LHAGCSFIPTGGQRSSLFLDVLWRHAWRIDTQIAPTFQESIIKNNCEYLSVASFDKVPPDKHEGGNAALSLFGVCCEPSEVFC